MVLIILIWVWKDTLVRFSNLTKPDFMTNYWSVITKSGETKTENTCQWSEVEKNIEELSLYIPDNKQKITLPKGFEYIQAKTASADLNGSNTTIESRYLGLKFGNNIVKIRVNEKNNNISIEVE